MARWFCISRLVCIALMLMLLLLLLLIFCSTNAFYPTGWGWGFFVVCLSNEVSDGSLYLFLVIVVWLTLPLIAALKCMSSNSQELRTLKFEWAYVTRLSRRLSVPFGWRVRNSCFKVNNAARLVLFVRKLINSSKQVVKVVNLMLKIAKTCKMTR